MLTELLEKYEPVMGLEVHAQLRTHTKLMSAASVGSESEPNSQISAICIGLPGALPVLNKKAVEMAIKTAHAFGCTIRNPSIFSRKHYFYPDLPKGYQISQYDLPYAENGVVRFMLNGEERQVRLERIHMEEDAGKNLHLDERGVSLVDLNRSSVPLLEIVSKPEIHSAAEAAAYMKALRLVLRYIEVCDGNLEAGNLRCDANVSLKLKGATKLGTRVELKNINSFRNVERAIENEMLRQFELLESGGKVTQETRLWNAEKNKSFSMRSKEEASDYRYMPEPDLQPLFLSEESLKTWKSSLPELPLDKANRYIKEYGRSPYDAEVLTASIDLAQYFETTTRELGDAQLASTFIQTQVLSVIQNIEEDLKGFYPGALELAALLKKVKDKTLSLTMAKEVFDAMRSQKKPAEDIIKEKGLVQVNDEALLLQTVGQVISANPKELADYRGGKEKLFGFFMGECQKILKGKANPQSLKDLLKDKLQS